MRTAGELLDAYAVRRNVFIIEQQVPESIERDHLDRTAEHVVAYVDGVAAGAGRLVVEGGVGKVGRMAVRASARRRGIGARMLTELEAAAAESGCDVVELHAQLHAAPFYQRAGYATQGESFLEAGIEHVTMQKRLTAH
ncbi:MAG: GNAT family N-acetyltransferase [Actinomycetota bacterium]